MSTVISSGFTTGAYSVVVFCSYCSSLAFSAVVSSGFCSSDYIVFLPSSILSDITNGGLNLNQKLLLL